MNNNGKIAKLLEQVAKLVAEGDKTASMIDYSNSTWSELTATNDSVKDRLDAVHEFKATLINEGGRDYFKVGEDNYYIQYDSEQDKVLRCIRKGNVSLGGIWFDTKAQADKAKSELNEEFTAEEIRSIFLG